MNKNNIIILIIAILAIFSAWAYKNNEKTAIRNQKLIIAKAKEKEAIALAKKKQEKLYYDLLLSIKSNNIEQLINLINKNQQVDINKHFKKGNSLLHLAAVSRSYEITYFLLQQGADIDAVNDSEQTALHLATLASADDIVVLLLREGANYKLVDNNRNRAVDVAAGRYDEPLLRILRYLEY